MNHRLARQAAVLTAAAVVVVPSLPASAGTGPIPLPADSAGLAGTYNSPGATYRVTTNTNYWSAVWVKPVSTEYVNYDLTVYSPTTGARLGTSSYRGFPEYRMVDFIAINSNVRPHGSYDANVHWQYGNGSYQVGFRQENKMLLPMSVTQPVYTLSVTEQNMIIRDVHLEAGQCLGVKVWNYSDSFGVLGVIPADPSRSVSGLRPDEGVVYGQSVTSPSVTMRYTAVSSGWHAFVLTNVPWRETYPLSILPRYQRVTC